MRRFLFPALALGAVVACRHAGGVLLFLREERGHFAAGAEGVHHLGPGREGRNLHRAAEVRRQRPRFRHGHPDADPAEAARDAARFLQAPCDLHDHETARVRRSRSCLPLLEPQMMFPGGGGLRGGIPPPPMAAMPASGAEQTKEREPAIKILEAGVVGSLDYKIIEAGRADDLFKWLKDNKYSYSGDEATLELLHPEEMALHGHEDRHHADETQQGRHLRRRSHADALPVHQRQARLSAQDHADLGA